MFNGGQADLELIDLDDPLEAGLEIMTQPPGKSFESLTLLSGGEQASDRGGATFGVPVQPAPIRVPTRSMRR